MPKIEGVLRQIPGPFLCVVFGDVGKHVLIYLDYSYFVWCANDFFGERFL